MQTTLRDGRICGAEALMRWRHPKRGMISPAEFIPLAEETEAIIPMGEWALRTACRDAAEGKIPGNVAVNLSPVQFGRDDLAETIHSILLETGLSPRRLEVEVTELTIMSDQSRGLHILRKLKAMGISVSMDDFGTGYSSLATLHAFPFDKIKLDQSFVKRLPEDAAAAAIVRTVLALGESLGMPVLAEGIETEAQWQFLTAKAAPRARAICSPRPREPRPTAGRNRGCGALRSRRAAGPASAARQQRRSTPASGIAVANSPQAQICPNARGRVTLLAFQASIFSTRQENGMADNKKKRGGADRSADRIERALRGRLLVEEIQDHAGQTESRRQESGHSAKNVEAYLKLQKHKAADRARIALSQPYEVSYWSKKFKVTPAKLKAAVAAVGHSSKNVGAYLASSKAKKSAKKASKKAAKKTAKKRAKKKAA